MNAQHPSSPLEPVARDARREAEERLRDRYETRVLEPSPPTVTQGPWFADDPIALGDGSLSRPLVSPVSNGNLLWDDLAREDEELAAWCASRWLGAWPRLQAPPEHLVRTRQALHKVAEHVISPTRKRANDKIGLRYTWGGFGTPFFGKNVQIRVAGDALIVQIGERVQHGRLTTLEDAAEFIGFDLTRYDLAGADEPLQVDAAASSWLGEWFGFAASVLAQLRVESPEDLERSHMQLWPEHFDMAVELGSEQQRRRATYGASPGDAQHEEPYLYVSPWEGVPDDAELWNGQGFRGAQLSLGELLAAESQREVALEFLRERRDALASSRGAQ
ncbi:MAG TPA: hypothetical protein VID70_06380 [Solirubrobacteraceae bacterium]